MQPAADDWLIAPDSQTAGSAETEQPAPSTTARLVANRSGLLVVGGIAGAVMVAALHHGGGSTPTQTANVATVPNAGNGTFPGGQGAAPGFGTLPGGQGPGGFGGGGLAGEEHVTGTLTNVGAASITVRAAGGTHTYAITANTQIVRNGVSSTLSSLRAGDTVLVHVYPATGGSGFAVERVFAQS